MTLRRPRLARLLDVRRVRLRLVSRDLARAARTAAEIVGMALRIDELRGGMDVKAGGVDGYDLKAAAATRSALSAVGARQVVRVAEAEAYRAHLAGEVRHQRAAADVVARAVDKAINAEPRR